MLDNEIVKNWRQIMKLASAMLVASLSEIVMGLVDTAFIGRLGEEKLASVAIAISLFSLVIQIVVASVIGYQIMGSRHFGAGDLPKLGETLVHSGLITGALALFGGIFLWTSRPILQIMSSDPVVVAGAFQYLLFRSPVLLIFALFMLLKTTLDISKQAKWGMYATLLANGFNIPLSYVLIFGWGPISPMGLTGAALGSTFASLTSLLFIIVVFSLKFRELLSGLTFRKEGIGQLSKLSFPEIFNAGADYFGNIVFVWIIGLLGTYALAGGRISFMILIVLFSVAISLGVATQILVGHAIGKKDPVHISGLVKSGRILIMVILCLLGSLLVAFPSVFIALFTPSQVLLENTSSAVVVVGLTAPFIGWTCLHVGLLRAFGRTGWVMYSNLGAIWLFQLPVAWFCGVYLEWGLMGIYFGFLIYFLIRSGVSHLLTSREIKRVSKDFEAKGAIAG